MTILTPQKMSAFVFDLSPDYQNIIKYLAEHGSGNITKISQFTKNSEECSLDRWAVKKRIYGSSRFQSLLDRDYLIEKLEDKHRYKKNEKTFYLTSKGILASFSTTTMQNNIAFRNVLEFANRITKGKKQARFLQEFIVSQIKLYLAYLYIQGIQLTWQNDTWLTYNNFLRTSENNLQLKIKDKQIMSEFRKLFEEYVILRSVYFYLGGRVSKDFSVEQTNLWRYIDDSKLPKINKEKKSWEVFVMKWFLSPQSQLSTSKSMKQMKPSEIPEFTDDEHIFSRLNVLEKQLIKKINSLN